MEMQLKGHRSFEGEADCSMMRWKMLTEVYRWHQDVKPENILVLSNGSKNPQDWHFKLADLGISHFKRGESLREDSTASDSYGTHTYGTLDSRHLEVQLV